ncbi:MAG TPA: TlpA disulfide reductase family protein [Kiritimatiellia bacterium]|nr:TlpA disulfide reductase family protein [Kiritimatiellia bacterium]
MVWTVFSALFLANLVEGTPLRKTSSGAPDYQTELLGILSGLQALAQGTFSMDEWNSYTDRLDVVLNRARERGDDHWVIESTVLKAKIASEMRHQHAEALAMLRGVKQAYRTRADLTSMRKVYVEEAAILGRMGDEAGVNRVIREFRESVHFDPTFYDFQGGRGPNDPLVVTRPRVAGSESIAVTSMNVQRQRAHFAPGQLFPDFNLVDSSGRPLRLSDYRGRVVLVDFWAHRMTPWRNGLPQVMDMYSRFHPLGLEVIGINLERDAQAAEAFAVANGIPWRRVYGDQSLSRELGIFGQPATYLIDGQGIILARDLRGSELNAAIRQALGMRP